MADAIKGNGILWVRCKIAQSAKDILDEKTFMKWYDEEHIAEIVKTSGIKSGFRYIDVKKTSPLGDEVNPKPFLAFYPMPDVAFTLGDEFRKIGFQSTNLPGTGIVYDLADLDVSYLGFLRATEKKEQGPAKYVVTSGIRPKNDPGRASLDSFFDKQTAIVSKAEGYQRTIRFRLLYARTNAQSRKLKGLPYVDEPAPEPSNWLAMHEFSSTPEDDLIGILRHDTENAVKTENWGETDIEVYAWRLDKVHGTGKLFEDAESGLKTA